MEIPDSVQKRVEAGAQFLDKKRPGWYKKVKTPVTGSVMVRGNKGKHGCVACQVVGEEYWRSLALMGVSDATFKRQEGRPNDVELGFMADTDEIESDRRDEWRQLGAAWTQQIECRRELDKTAKANEE